MRDVWRRRVLRHVVTAEVPLRAVLAPDGEHHNDYTATTAPTAMSTLTQRGIRGGAAEAAGWVSS
jgi:hypothetical protein